MKNIIALILAISGLSAAAWDSPFQYPKPMTNVPTMIPAAGSSNVVSFVVRRPNLVDGLYVTGNGTNNVTNTFALVFLGSVDGTTNTTFPLFTQVFSITGTNAFRYFTNIALGPVPFVMLSQITNGATGVTNLTVNWVLTR